INIKTFQKDSEEWVKFDVNPIQNNAKAVIHCEAKLVDQRVVKSSSGFREKRYVISTKLSIGEKNWDIEVTLTNRDSMGYRMLLGREAMSGRVLVDPEARFLLGQPTKEKLKEYYYSDVDTKKGLKIGLLASNPDLYSNKRIIEAGEIRGHEMHFLNLKYCYMKLDAETPEIHYRGGKR